MTSNEKTKAVVIKWTEKAIQLVGWVSPTNAEGTRIMKTKKTVEEREERKIEITVIILVFPFAQYLQKINTQFQHLDNHL